MSVTIPVKSAYIILEYMSLQAYTDDLIRPSNSHDYDDLEETMQWWERNKGRLLQQQHGSGEPDTSATSTWIQG
jgi:hypothetical protein